MDAMGTESADWTMAFLAALTGAAGRGLTNKGAVEVAEEMADEAVAMLARRAETRATAEKANAKAERDALLAKVTPGKRFTCAGRAGGRLTVTVERVEGNRVHFTDESRADLADIDDGTFEPVPTEEG